MLSHSGACRCMESDLYLNVLWNLYPCSGRTAAFIIYSFTWFWNHAFPQPSQICPAEPLRVGSVLSSGTHPSWIPSSPKLSHTCTLKKKIKNWKKECKGTADDLCQAGCIRRTYWSKKALDWEEVSPLFQALSLILGTRYGWWHQWSALTRVPFYATEPEAARPLIPPKLPWDLGT